MAEHFHNGWPIIFSPGINIVPVHNLADGTGEIFRSQDAAANIPVCQHSEEDAFIIGGQQHAASIVVHPLSCLPKRGGTRQDILIDLSHWFLCALSYLGLEQGGPETTQGGLGQRSADITHHRIGYRLR